MKFKFPIIYEIKEYTIFFTFCLNCQTQVKIYVYILVGNDQKLSISTRSLVKHWILAVQSILHPFMSSVLYALLSAFSGSRKQTICHGAGHMHNIFNIPLLNNSAMNKTHSLFICPFGHVKTACQSTVSKLQ